jgi:hypothetical protein
MTEWQRWPQHPERSRARNAIFQIHLMLGAVVSAYILLMSFSGSVIVHRNELSESLSIERLVDLHGTYCLEPLVAF